MKKEDKKRKDLWLTKSLLSKLEKIAKDNGVDTSSMIRLILCEYVKNYP